VACHREGGAAFSLAEYKDAFPWRTAIKEEVLERRMPPWGAVKGFGDFRNDQALTPEQLELLTSWSQGGSPEGEDKDLPSKGKLDEMMKETAWLGDGTLIAIMSTEVRRIRYYVVLQRVSYLSGLSALGTFLKKAGTRRITPDFSMNLAGANGRPEVAPTN